MSVYGEGKYECPVHGVVNPLLRSQEQLEAHQWELLCPISLDTGGEVCGEVLLPLPTDESKPLQPTSLYAITKRSQEEMCLSVGKAYGIPTVALRYFNTYGTRQALSNPYTGVVAIFCSRLLNGNSPVVYEDGGQSRDFVHVKDVVQANLIAIRDEAPEFGVFNVGSGKVVTVAKVAKQLIALLDHGKQPQILDKFRAGDIRHCYPELIKVEEIGYRSGYKFEDTILELVEWVQSQQALDYFDGASDILTQRSLVR
jgi:dTDP-L-rhamnose 4-epimerase